MTLRSLAPEASASANSATSAYKNLIFLHGSNPKPEVDFDHTINPHLYKTIKLFYAFFTSVPAVISFINDLFFDKALTTITPRTDTQINSPNATQPRLTKKGVLNT